jgi:hypothetical protein
MATVENGINGMVSGTAGPVVGVKGKDGKNYARSKPKQTVKAKSKPLQPQHKNLAIMSEMLALAKNFIAIGFVNKKKKGQQMTLAMKYNLQHAIVHLDNESVIDYSALKFSRGKRERVWSEELFFKAGGVIQASWEVPEALSMKHLGNDEAKVIIYNVNSNRLLHMNCRPLRSDLKFKKKLLAADAGDTIHVWMFFVSPDGKEVSDSDYLGSGVILP